MPRYIVPFIIIILLVTFTGIAFSDHYPVVVYGGEPAGIMAAVAAARNGSRTLLIMEKGQPGGLMTYGCLNYLDLNHGSRGQILGNNLFHEWHQRVGGDVTFSVTRAEEVFNNMLAGEENLTVYRNSKLLNVKKKNNLITHINIEKGNKKLKIYGDRFIDSTRDADFAAMSGVPFFVGGADIGQPKRTMAVTLILHMGNIDVNKLKKDIYSNKYGPSYLDHDHAWGFVKIGQLYKPHHTSIRLRGLNIVLSEQNSAYINALLIFDVNPLAEKSLQKAYQKGKKEAKYVLNFLGDKLSGFKNAKLLSFPEELYVRESRHILARYQLKTEDLLANKIFSDSIALASYPLDYQAADSRYHGFVLFNPDKYGIPLRSLIAKNIDNLMIAGRSSGYSSMAAASARILPTGMSTGEAAGLVASISIKRNKGLIEIPDDKELMNYIHNIIGIDIGNNNSKHIINDRLVFPFLKELVSWGLVMGGYNNDFNLQGRITEREFANILIKGLKQRKAPIFYEWVPGGLTTLSNNDPLTRDRAAMLLLAATSHRLSDIVKRKYFKKALDKELIPELFTDIVKDNKILNRKQAFILAGYFLDKYPTDDKIKEYRGENGG